jgi:hypothetical protein
MRLRLILPLALLAVASLVAPACSGGDDGDSAARTSEERESTDGGADSGGGADEGGDPGADSGSEGSDEPGDITESIPGLENLGDCFDLATAYSSLYVQAISGDAAEAQKQAEELKAQLPEDLHDDIDVVAAAIGEVAEEGPLSGSSALTTPEYQDADSAITDYLQKECGG